VTAHNIILYSTTKHAQTSLVQTTGA